MFDQEPALLKFETINAPTFFSVNAMCLKLGMPKFGRACMASLAIEESGGEYPFVDDAGVCSFSFFGKRYVGVSKSLVLKVSDYDNGRRVVPFQFRLEKVKSFHVDDVEGIEHYENELMRC